MAYGLNVVDGSGLTQFSDATQSEFHIKTIKNIGASAMLKKSTSFNGSIAAHYLHGDTAAVNSVTQIGSPTINLLVEFTLPFSDALNAGSIYWDGPEDTSYIRFNRVAVPRMFLRPHRLTRLTNYAFFATCVDVEYSGVNALEPTDVTFRYVIKVLLLTESECSSTTYIPYSTAEARVNDFRADTYKFDAYFFSGFHRAAPTSTETRYFDPVAPGSLRIAQGLNMKGEFNGSIDEKEVFLNGSFRPLVVRNSKVLDFNSESHYISHSDRGSYTFANDYQSSAFEFTYDITPHTIVGAHDKNWYMNPRFNVSISGGNSNGRWVLEHLDPYAIYIGPTNNAAYSTADRINRIGGISQNVGGLYGDHATPHLGRLNEINITLYDENYTAT